MESYSRQNAQSHEVKAMLCVGVLLVVISIFYSSLNKPPARPAAAFGREQFPNYLENPEAGAAKANELVKKARGNYDRLTPNEQRWLDSLSAGHGAMMVVETW